MNSEPQTWVGEGEEIVEVLSPAEYQCKYSLRSYDSRKTYKRPAGHDWTVEELTTPPHESVHVSKKLFD